jgi:hypothetical protein
METTTITLLVTGPNEFGLRKILARDGEGPLLSVGFCSAIAPELLAPDGPRWSSVLWDVAGQRGIAVPRGGHAGPARQSAEEIKAVLEARLAERGPWWLEAKAA